jgi:hypothetical protein
MHVTRCRFQANYICESDIFNIELRLKYGLRSINPVDFHRSNECSQIFTSHADYVLLAPNVTEIAPKKIQLRQKGVFIVRHY